MSIQSPAYFLLLIPLLFAFFWIRLRARQRTPSFQFSNVDIVKGVYSGLRTQLHKLPLVFKFAALALMIFALARPQESNTRIKRNVEGIDIMITIDVSDSMVIEDMQPWENRISAAKAVAKEFVQKRISDRIGLVVFSGEAFTKVPPTLDYKLLTQTIDTVDIDRSIKDGTAIGVGLANAVSHLRDSTAKSRVVIFLTDGGNNTGTIDPDTALEIAKGYGIRIYTIGIGKNGIAQLPIVTEDAFGHKHKHYQPMESDVNDELLGKMANETGGKYYRVSDGEAMQKVFHEIDKLERSKIDVNKYTRFGELYQPYLRWALFFYLFSFAFERLILRRAP